MKLSDLEYIIYKLKNDGIDIFNVSSWNSGSLLYNAYKNLILGNHDAFNSFDYIFQRDFKDMGNYPEAYGLDSSAFSNIVCYNSTQSLYVALNFIKVIGVDRILLVKPVYFSVTNVCKAINLSYDEIDICDSQHVINNKISDIKNNKYGAIFITNPIFSSSNVISEDFINFVKIADDNGVYIVCDECFCIPSNSFINTCGQIKNFIAITSPHKAISCNSFKFSSVIYPQFMEKKMYEITDTWVGGLNNSVINSYKNFISGDYFNLLDLYKNLSEQRKDIVSKILLNHNDFKISMHITHGIILISSEKYTYNERIYRVIDSIIKEKKCVFFPNNMVIETNSCKFSFRVNILLERASLSRSLSDIFNCIEGFA